MPTPSDLLGLTPKTLRELAREAIAAAAAAVTRRLRGKQRTTC